MSVYRLVWDTEKPWKHFLYVNKHEAPDKDPEINAFLLSGSLYEETAAENLVAWTLDENKKADKAIIETYLSCQPRTDVIVRVKMNDAKLVLIGLDVIEQPPVELGYFAVAEDGEWIIRKLVPDPETLEEAKTRKASDIAKWRWENETGGVTVLGITVATDRESQALITGAVLQAMADREYTCRWKTAAGFMGLSNEGIIAVGAAVRQHVQACFDREAALLDAVDVRTDIESVMAIEWGDEIA